MKVQVTAALAVCAVLVAASVPAFCGHKKQPQAAPAAPTAFLPPNAVPGECYARVITPAVYRDVVEQVVTREAREDIRMIPAEYQQVSEEVLVTPATQRTVDVPAVYDMVDRQVEVEPARAEWRKGDCDVHSVVDNATGECWCLVQIPAVMKTVTERVVRTPATTQTIEVPAVYQTVSKRIVSSPAREERIPVPAVVENVTHRELVTPEKVSWVKIPCEPHAKEKPHADNELYSFPRLDNFVH